MCARLTDPLYIHLKVVNIYHLPELTWIFWDALIYLLSVLRLPLLLLSLFHEASINFLLSSASQSISLVLAFLCVSGGADVSEEGPESIINFP